LWWLMFWTCTAVYVIVITMVLLAVRRGRAEPAGRTSDRTLLRSVVAATSVTIVILFGLLFASVTTGRAVASPGSRDALVIEITGHQWWWDVTYHHPEPSLRVRTANE